jgi:16S rRNA (guanine527-N7)-methyltransferase
VGTDTAKQILGEGPFGALLHVLEQSRHRGFLGPGPLEPHIERALAALALLPEPLDRALDLGSGGGLPGLPLALARPDVRWTLLDGSATRCRFLEETLTPLGLASRVEVVQSRAEAMGRDPGRRGVFEVVVARSFGPPAVTAECAAPFLRVGGRLVVAEPPGPVDRWPAAGLVPLGMEPEKRITEPAAYQVLRQVEPCPDRYPRRIGIPAKRPLF